MANNRPAYFRTEVSAQKAAERRDPHRHYQTDEFLGGWLIKLDSETLLDAKGVHWGYDDIEVVENGR